MNEVAFGKHLRRGSIARGPDLWGGERGWRVSSVTKGWRLNQLCVCNEASIKTPEGQGWESCGADEQVEVQGEEPPGEGMGAPLPCPMPCPTHLFLL